MLEFTNEIGKLFITHISICLIFRAHDFGEDNKQAVSPENFDERLLAGLLIGEKARHSTGEFESQSIVLPI